MALLVILCGLVYPVPASAGVSQTVYNELKTNYSGYIEKLTANGATEGDIQAFLQDLDMEIQASGGLTAVNFDGKILTLSYKLVNSPQYGDKHRRLYEAMQKGYGSEGVQLEQGNLPSTLIPLRNVLKSHLLVLPVFKDVPIGYWAAKDIELMVARGVAQGVTQDEFRPDNPVTREQFAAFIKRALNLPDAPVFYTPFTDVPGTSKLATSVAAAAKAGIITGFSDGKFHPTEPITREQVAAMVIRALKYSGKDVTLQPAELELTLKVFADAQKISPGLRQETAVAISLGIVKGSGGKIDPKARANRAQAVVMIKRLLVALGQIQE
ncbi:MAG: S-layer homology domain-containing protein [Bacillota bacterium]